MKEEVGDRKKEIYLSHTPQEKQALAEKLEESERKLEETQRNKQEKTMEALTIQEQYVSHSVGLI